MAILHPLIDRSVLFDPSDPAMRVLAVVESLLDDDYLIWHDVPIGGRRRRPDILIFHPTKGLLFLEVRDWSPDDVLRVEPNGVVLQRGPKGTLVEPDPLEAARQHALEVIELLADDPHLGQARAHGWATGIGWGVILAGMPSASPELRSQTRRGGMWPAHLVIDKSELGHLRCTGALPERLERMFGSQPSRRLDDAQLERLRWHLFPELRIDRSAASAGEQADGQHVLDSSQERAARPAYIGHRIVQGASGTGKTRTLVARCRLLAGTSGPPVLVLTPHAAQAARLSTEFTALGLAQRVVAHDFVAWCADQLARHQIALPAQDPAPAESDEVAAPRDDTKALDPVVEAFAQALAETRIPALQYRAILVDDAHDVPPAWLRLVLSLSDPVLCPLTCFDDGAREARSGGIRSLLGLAGGQLAEGGQAVTLERNYRNAAEVLSLARHVGTLAASSESGATADSGIAAGNSFILHHPTFERELEHAVERVRQWLDEGLAGGAIGLFCATRAQSAKLARRLEKIGIPTQWLATRRQCTDHIFRPETVTVMPLEQCRGFEFERVLIIGVNDLDASLTLDQGCATIHHGVTRARTLALISTSGDGALARALLANQTLTT